MQMSERRVCRVLGQARSTQRQIPFQSVEDDRLRHQITELAVAYGRYGYRRITEQLRAKGWSVNHKRVERIWREEGLKVPRKQRKRKRLWLGDGSTVRLRANRRNHVWTYDFVLDTTSDGRKLRMLTIVDEYSRECLAIRVGRSISASDVLDTLAELFQVYGTPEFIRSDNGPEFVADVLREWLGRLGVQTLFIEPGSPWENGYIESFNGKFRDELLNGEIFDTVLEAKVLIEEWRWEYNTCRPHSSLKYKTPAPVTFLPLQTANALEGNPNIGIGT